MKVERGIGRTYEDLINNTTSDLLWIDGKKVEEAELCGEEAPEPLKPTFIDLDERIKDKEEE